MRMERRPMLLAALLACAACATPSTQRVRSLEGTLGGLPPSRGIAYGMHRDGQRPGGASPTREEMAEDLRLLRGRWTLLRVYGADPVTEELLALIRDEKLPFRVLLGAWIAPGAPEANRKQVEAALRLAREYPGIVAALCIGNETQVSWSAHRLPADELVGWIREARRGTALPVGTADDYGYWIEPGSAAVAREVDFLAVHVHPLWNGKGLAEGLAFTRDRLDAVAAVHPGVPIVIGETGWATRRGHDGDQGKLIRGEVGEVEQAAFLREYLAWVDGKGIPAFWFEAFDENWKGGPSPDDVEKHWGLFDAARRPKQAAAAVPPLP